MPRPASFTLRDSLKLINAGMFFSLMAAIALVIGAVGLNEYSYRQSEAAKHSMVQSLRERGLIHELLQYTLDAETGQRGYMITGDEKYLQPYNNAVDKIGTTLNLLRETYAQKPENLSRFSQLSRGISRKLAELDMTVRLRKNNPTDSVWRTVVETGVGNDYMENVRSVARQGIEQSTQEIHGHIVQFENTLLFGRTVIPLMSLAGLAAFVLYLNQSVRLLRSSEDQNSKLQEEHDRLGTLVQERTAMLSELTTHVQNLQEKEREHLARELHDELGALLTAAKLDVSRIKAKLATDPVAVQERLQHLITTLNAGIALKRRIIEDLRPSTLSKLGLNPALDILVREFSERSGIDVQTSFDPVSLGPDTDLAIYRIVQEALTNAAKYAQATSIQVAMHKYPQHTEISITDNGVGFEPSKRPNASHGLMGMRHRVTSRNGQLHVISSPGHGTRIEAHLPNTPAPVEPSPSDASLTLPPLLAG